MEKFYKKLKITRFVLYVITAIFLLLQLLWQPFVYFAIITASLALICLAAYQLLSYSDLKRDMKDGYHDYLVDAYKTGTISQAQLDANTKDLYPVYKRMFTGELWTKFGLFILFFGLAITLIAVLIKLVF